MNAKTAKLLRRFARDAGKSYRGMKKLWRATPRALRPELRQSMKADLAE